MTMRHLRLLPFLLVLAACGEKQEAPRTEQAPAVEQTMENTSGVTVQAGDDANVTVNYQKSQDYRDFVSQRDKLRERIHKYPDDPTFRQELALLETNMQGFERDVLKLAEDIQKIPINTERLKKAKQHFDAGEYVQARAVLDAEGITQEQDALLAEQQRLQEKQTAINAQLEDKANEWLLKAQLTAIDYSLGGQRIAQTSGYFEKVLKSGRTPEHLFDYAKFLQDNNQYREAETLYTEALRLYRQLAKDNSSVCQRDMALTLNNLGALVAGDSQRRKEAETLYAEALTSYRQLAKDNPAAYQLDVAATLNNLGILVVADSQRRKEAETLFTEALTLRRQFAKNNSVVYQSNVADTLNNLGNLVSDDSQRRKEAETLYAEVLTIRRQLAKDDPAVHQPYVAMTLNNFGNLVATDSQRRKEAETLYTEALTLYRQLLKENPAVYQADVAMTLNNLGALVVDHSQRRKEVETIYTEALISYRQLAKANPAIYQPDVANTLGAFGMAYLNWEESAQALPLLQESAQLFAPLAKQSPGVFGEKYDIVLQLLEIAKAAKR